MFGVTRPVVKASKSRVILAIRNVSLKASKSRVILAKKSQVTLAICKALPGEHYRESESF